MWVAPLKLHTQSKDKLEEYYSNVKTLTCSSTQDLHNDEIGENEILFIKLGENEQSWKHTARRYRKTNIQSRKL